MESERVFRNLVSLGSRVERNGVKKPSLSFSGMEKVPNGEGLTEKTDPSDFTRERKYENVAHSFTSER
jgi:hypothetical protein